MDAQNNAAPRKRLNGTIIAGAVAVLLAAFVLIFAVTVNSSVSPTSVAGDMGTGTTMAQQAASGTAGAQPSTRVIAAGSALDAQSVGEVIADDSNPLSAYPAANPLEGITWLLLACIAGATVFFLVATRRMNRDIASMKQSIR